MENWKTLRGKGLKFSKRRSCATSAPSHAEASVLWNVNWDTVDMQYVSLYISIFNLHIYFPLWTLLSSKIHMPMILVYIVCWQQGIPVTYHPCCATPIWLHRPCSTGMSRFVMVKQFYAVASMCHNVHSKFFLYKYIFELHNCLLVIQKTSVMSINQFTIIFAFTLFSRRSAPPYLEIINGSIIFPPDETVLASPAATLLCTDVNITMPTVASPEG